METIYEALQPIIKKYNVTDISISKILKFEQFIITIQIDNYYHIGMKFGFKDIMMLSQENLKYIINDFCNIELTKLNYKGVR